jgi:hypothetical protein
MSQPITITVEVDKAAAVRAGVDEAGTYELPVQPSQLSDGAREFLADWLSGRRTLYVSVPVLPTPDSIHAWLEANGQALAAKRKAEMDRQEKNILEALEMPDSAWIGTETSFLEDGMRHYEPSVRANGPEGVYLTEPERKDPRIAMRMKAIAEGELFRRMHAEWEAKHAAYLKRQAEAKVQAERRAAEITEEQRRSEARRADQLATWLATKAPEAMRKRHARALLPEQDLISAIRDEVFAPLADLPRFPRLTDEEVRRNLNAEEYDEVSYVTRDAQSASDEDIDLMEHIERVIPGAKCELREHVGFLKSRDDADDPEVCRKGILVTVKVGELTLSREYAAAEADPEANV